MGAESAKKSILDTYGIASVVKLRQKNPEVSSFPVDEIEFTFKKPVDLYALGGILKEMGYSIEIVNTGVIHKDEGDVGDGHDPEETVAYLTGSAKIYEITPSFFGREKKRCIGIVSRNDFFVISDRTVGDYTDVIKKYGVQVLEWKDDNPVFDFLIDSMSGN